MSHFCSCTLIYYMTFFFIRGGGPRKSYVILMGGHAKCLLLMTRGEGGGSKIPKTCLRNTWMFPYYRYLFVKMKVFNYSELHFSKVTSYKIHTLAILLKYNHWMLCTDLQPRQSWQKTFFPAFFIVFINLI